MEDVNVKLFFSSVLMLIGIQLDSNEWMTEITEGIWRFNYANF